MSAAGRLAAAALLALAGALHVAPAHAFCRSRTVSERTCTGDETRACCRTRDDAGCCAEGQPLFWRSACVGFFVAAGGTRQLGLAAVEDAAQGAFAPWVSASCGAAPASIDMRFLGEASCADAGYAPDGPNQNVVVFRDDRWPYSAPGASGAAGCADTTTLALTTVTFDHDTGEILDADIEVNTAPGHVVAVGGAAAGPCAHDLRAILTHEAGHFLGLAHSPDDGAIMNRTLHEDGFALTDDDRAGLCAIYPAPGARATARGLVSSATCDPRALGGTGGRCDEASKGCTASQGAPSPALPSVVFGLVAAAGVRAARRRRR